MGLAGRVTGRRTLDNVLAGGGFIMGAVWLGSIGLLYLIWPK